VISRYGLNAGNIGDVTAAIKANNVSVAFFYGYTVTEGGGAGGFINHWLAKDMPGTAVADAEKDAGYLNSQSKVMDSKPSWIDAGNPVDFVPQDVKDKGEADFQNMPSGTIGRTFIPATAAAAWEVYYPDGLKVEFNKVQNYGTPLKTVMDAIVKMGGNPTANGSSSSSGNSTSSIQYSYSDGIFSGIDGLTDKTADFESVREHKDTALDAKQILLHSSEGTSWAYGNNKSAAHFFVNPVTKQAQQHVPTNIKAGSTATGDNYSIQIEIVGYAYSEANSDYYLQNYGDAEWDYLATFMIAIATELNISLDTSVNWENPVRFTPEEISNYSGVLGHMHVDKDTTDPHSDPGNIWAMVKAAIERGGVASSGDECNSSTTKSTTGAKVVTAAAEIIEASNQYGSAYGTKHRGNWDFIDKFVTGNESEQLVIDCTGFTSLAVYRATGLKLNYFTGSFYDEAAHAPRDSVEGYEKVSTPQPGDIGINHRISRSDHGFIVIEVTNGVVTKTAETGGKIGRSGLNDNLGYKDCNDFCGVDEDGGTVFWRPKP
jgi:hypothetical protein